MRFSRTTLLALGLILLGVVVFLGTAVGGLWTWTNFMASGIGITVPCTVEIDLKETGKDMVVWRELAGTHITSNRPLNDPPADLDIEIVDRQTNEPIETHPHQWRVQQTVMPGFERKRQAICLFTPPAHGQITLSVAGTFPHDQVYRVAPSIVKRAQSMLPVFQFGLIGGLLIFLVGVGMLVVKAVRQERDAARETDQPLA